MRGGNVAAMLSAAVAADPDKDAVVEPGRVTTYESLAGRAGAMASILSESGVVPGDRVVVLLDRGADAVAAYFGVLATGAMTVVLNAVLRPRQVEYVLEHSGARALLTSTAVLRRWHRDLDTTAEVLTVDDLPSAPYRPLDARPDDPAQITYTSGSTGMPKGVVASHANVRAAIDTVAGYLGLEPSDRIAGLLPPSGVYGQNQVLCSVHVGATLVVPTSPIMNDVARELHDAGVTVLAAVPPLWLQLLAAPEFTERPMPSLRILQNAGGHLPPSAASRLRSCHPGARLFLQYGMTEVFRSTFLPPDEIERRAGSMGRAMPGTEILVVREDGSLCEDGEVGELVHAGPTVALGYWNDPERTASVFRPHPVTGEGRAVHSGDMVRRDADGFLYFVGRKDRMIKTLGYRVGPDEIVDVLHASGLVADAAVGAREDRTRGQAIVAWVVLKDEATLADLRRYCRAELPRYMQPAHYVEMEALPRLPNGKHDLPALEREPVPA